MEIINKLGIASATTLLSLFVLFFLTKLIGNRQVSQLSMFDYINGITIGSIAAELATNLENWHITLTALILYGLVTLLIDYINDKSIKARRFIEGRSLLIYENGKFFRNSLKKSHLNVGEFLALCRCQGYFNLQDVESVYLESNGQISILPKTDKRPVNPNDLGLNPTQEYPMASVIIDGKILYENLKHTGKDEKWLMKQIHDNGIKDIKDVMLACCCNDNQLDIYIRLEKKIKDDIFI